MQARVIDYMRSTAVLTLLRISESNLACGYARDISHGQSTHTPLETSKVDVKIVLIGGADRMEQKVDVPSYRYRHVTFTPYASLSRATA